MCRNRLVKMLSGCSCDDAQQTKETRDRADRVIRQLETTSKDISKEIQDMIEMNDLRHHAH